MKLYFVTFYGINGKDNLTYTIQATHDAEAECKFTEYMQTKGFNNLKMYSNYSEFNELKFSFYGTKCFSA